MNANVAINTSVSWKYRFDSLPFRPTKTGTVNFPLSTTLDTYQNDLNGFSLEIYDYIVGIRAQGYQIDVHIAIRVDNVTHPTPGAGVVILPKAHRDLALTDLEVTSADVIIKTISDTVATLRTNSKY